MRTIPVCCFTPNGELLGDADAHALARQEGEAPLALGALENAYGHVLPRFYAGVCGPCRPARDGGDRLAAVHRALRLLHLSLRHSFSPCGIFVSAALDGGTPGVVWHKIAIDADLPEGTWLKVQTVTADDPAGLGDPLAPHGLGEHDDALAIEDPAFVPYEDASCAIKPILPSEVPDRLVFSPPGRWLRLRLTLGSDGSATPSVRAIRVFYSRVSYLDLLPRVFRRDPQSAWFLEHFLALFEHVFTGIENRYELFTRQLNPDAAPLDVSTGSRASSISASTRRGQSSASAPVAAAMDYAPRAARQAGLRVMSKSIPVSSRSSWRLPRAPPAIPVSGPSRISSARRRTSRRR
jgi:hypothetical protein